MVEKAKHLGSIRGRVTLVTILVALAEMAIVVGLSAYASWTSVHEVINRSLIERLDAAEEAVAVGDYARAADSTGSELLQIIDAHGNIVASSSNAHGLAAIAEGDEADEVDDFDFELDDDDEEDSDWADNASNYANDQTATDDDGESDDWDYDWDDGEDDAAWDSNQTETYDDSDDGDDDEDDALEIAPTATTNDTDDYDDDDDNDDYDDDNDDDDDAVSARSNANVSSAYTKRTIRSNGFSLLAPEVAHAAEIAESSEAATSLSGSSAGGNEENAGSLSASDVLGQPGPFLIMRRSAESPDGPLTLVAMTSLAPAVEVATTTAWEIAALLAVLLILTGLFTWYMTGRTLRPVEQMRREVEAISPTDLDKRITAPASDPDLSGLAITFNGLLARAQAALAEQKRFVSDASHELKSPIAATSLMLETLRTCPDQIRDRQIVDDLTAENDRMEHIVGDLLTLARQDEGRLSTQMHLADYCDILFEEADSLRRRCSVGIDDSGVSPVVGTTDSDLLSHALRNLLDNAARYAKTCVYISCTAHDNTVEIRISDDGPGIPPEDRERIFGRFVRLESDRSRAQGSTGLGLAVTRGIVEQLGGTVHFADPDHGGATAVIELPINPNDMSN